MKSCYADANLVIIFFLYRNKMISGTDDELSSEKENDLPFGSLLISSILESDDLNSGSNRYLKPHVSDP